MLNFGSITYTFKAQAEGVICGWGEVIKRRPSRSDEKNKEFVSL